MEIIDVDFLKLYDDVTLPKYETDGAAAMDVRAYLPKDKYPDGKIHIQPGKTILIPTGFKVAIPYGYKMNVLPRSGQSLKTQLRIANSPGTVDEDYRGEVGIIATNELTGDILVDTDKNNFSVFSFEARTQPLIINHGDKIAQIEFAPVTKARFNVTDKLSETKRGEGGFGSTGTK